MFNVLSLMRNAQFNALCKIVGYGWSSRTEFVQHTACILEFLNQLPHCAMGDGSSSGMTCVEVLCYPSIWPALTSTQQYHLNAFVFRQGHLQTVTEWHNIIYVSRLYGHPREKWSYSTSTPLKVDDFVQSEQCLISCSAWVRVNTVTTSIRSKKNDNGIMSTKLYDPLDAAGVMNVLCPWQ